MKFKNQYILLLLAPFLLLMTYLIAVTPKIQRIERTQPISLEQLLQKSD